MSIATQHTIPTLSPQALTAIHSQYPRHQGWKAVDALSQGERDVLEMARELLGWISITSLAYKYWPLYPDRQLWKRAMERCLKHKPHYKTHPIQYLLRAIQSVKEWYQRVAFTGNGTINRLLYTFTPSITVDTNRIVYKAGIASIEAFNPICWSEAKLLHFGAALDLHSDNTIK